MAGDAVPNGHDTLWFAPWFLAEKYHQNVQGESDATWGIHVAYEILGYHSSPQVQRKTSFHLQGWLMGSEETHWWVEHEHGQNIHTILGVVSGRINVQVAEQVNVSRIHVRPKKAMVVQKLIPYNCLWFDVGVVPDWDRGRQGHADSTATKIIFGIGENCRSTLAIDKAIVAHCQACHPWQWVLRLESNSLVAEEGDFCLGTHQ